MNDMEKTRVSLLIENVDIFTVDDDYTEYKNGCIAVDGNTIVYVGDMQEGRARYEGDEVIEGKGYLALPGLINTHTHSAMVLFRGYANDLPLWEWLSEKMWPLEDKIEADDAYWLSLLAMAEMIKAGTTTFSDMYMFMEETARGVDEVGLRAVLARGLQGPDESSDKRLKENRMLWERWEGKAGGRLKVMVGPHAIYTCSSDYLRECIELAKELDTGIHIHISETKGEVTESIEKHGKPPVLYLEELGLFEVPTLAAHCVHLQDEEVDILKDRNVSIAHCPYSNLKLASGFMPAAQFMEKGINVSLGTDGASSNNNLSILKEMQLASILGKAVAKSAQVLPAKEAVKMATINGAKALGWIDEIGSIEVGKRADIILLDTNKTHYRPIDDMTALLVYSGYSSDVDTVIVDGNILMDGRELRTIDLDRVYYEVDRIKERIMK